VVEDDVLVRSATAQYLRGVGFKVLEATHVEEALQLLGNGTVEAVFSDVKLPGEANGVDLAHIIRKDYPQVKILLTSGVSPLPSTEDLAFLKKPYFLFEVERHLKALLALASPRR